MKKLVAMLLPVWVVSLVIFSGMTIMTISSCDDNPDTTNLSQVPVLTVNPPSTLAFDVGRNEPISFHIEARANPNTKKDLKEVTVQVKYGTFDTLITYNVPSASGQYYPVDYEYVVPQTIAYGTKITIIITAVDKDMKKGTKSFVLTVVDNSGLKTYYIELGSYQSTLPSFFATNTGEYFTVSQALSGGQTKIDLVYFYGTTNAATVAAPDCEFFQSSTPGFIESLKIYNWTTKKNTRFRKVADVDSITFNNLNATQVQGLYNGASTDELSYANMLIDETSPHPSWVAFKTGTKYGILRVQEINGYAANGSIKLVVRVAK